jgi:signal transduction histidine kinase
MLSASHARKALPVLAFLLFGSISLVLWQNQNSHERELVFRHTESFAEQLRIRVEGLMSARIASLELLADRWVERQPPDFSHQRFLGFAELLHRRYPGYLGIFWIDPQGVIQWVFPADTNAAAVGRNLSEYPDPRYSSVLSHIQSDASVVATPCVALYHGGIGFHVLRALIHDDQLQGYLDGVFKVEQLMNICLTHDLLNELRVRVYEEDRLIYQFGYPDGALEGGEDEGETGRTPRAVREIKFAEKIWTLELEPGSESYPRRYLGNLPILLFGLSLSAVLSLLLYFLIQRMDMYKSSCDHALREVGERKRAQEALRENEKKLEALLAELTDKNTELEAFVYTVSHDLKTPIVTIEGFIGALREDFGEQITGTGEKYLRYMSDAARKMESLINDLLNLSRIGRVVEKKTEFSLSLSVKEAIETLQPQIEARSIVMSVQEDLPVVYAERKRIGQVMDNLLANAVKYIGKDNPDPRIDVGFEVQDGETVFFVRDNGIGVEEKFFDKIFQIFQRLPSAKRVSEGTGIGLTIVRRIVEHHGGRIWLESEPGKGATFYFTLKDKEN